MFFAACRRKEVPPPPVGTPGMTLSRDKVPLGSPVEITYRFDVAEDAPPFKEDYRVFVGVVDPDEELMWTDDHDRRRSDHAVEAGTEDRVHADRVRAGVSRTSARRRFTWACIRRRPRSACRCRARTPGSCAYKVGKIQLLPQTENVFTVFKEGWHGPETPQDNSSVEWQWTKKDARARVPEPEEGQCCCTSTSTTRARRSRTGSTCRSRSAGSRSTNFVAGARAASARKIPLTAAQLGAGGHGRSCAILVDKTFVPALTPGSANKDPRELGVRVFHAFVEPKK